MGNPVIRSPRMIQRLFGRREGSSSGAKQATADAEDPQASPSSGALAQSAANEEDPRPRTCPQCKAPMAHEQDWCTQCGERSHASRRARAGWYSAGLLTAVSAILASGAAAAGVAALTQTPAKESRHLSLAPVPSTTAAAPPTPAAPANPGSPETLKAPRSQPPSQLPKTPAKLPSPKPSPVVAAHVPAAAPSTPTVASTTHASSTSTQSVGPEATELQGLTASAYSLNPLYPTSTLEGPENDPSRALEGRESGTAWSIQVKPGTAENLNVGLQIALGGPTQVESVELHTSTPGFPLEIYATTSSQPPTALGAWRRIGLTPSLKASATLKVGETSKRCRFVLLWIPKVPSKLTHVSLGEVALFPPSP
jgi:hypothetical protein